MSRYTIRHEPRMVVGWSPWSERFFGHAFLPGMEEAAFQSPHLGDLFEWCRRQRQPCPPLVGAALRADAAESRRAA